MERNALCNRPGTKGGKDAKSVPPGRSRIAQRFIAGVQAPRTQVPSGTKEIRSRPGWTSNPNLSSLRDSCLVPVAIPAMNRWATFPRPSGCPTCHSTENSEGNPQARTGDFGPAHEPHPVGVPLPMNRLNVLPASRRKITFHMTAKGDPSLPHPREPRVEFPVQGFKARSWLRGILPMNRSRLR